MLKSSDLVSRSDFLAGPVFLSPGRRLVEGPQGTANVEPVVMKVLVSLLDANGAVVTREELFEKAWGGALVGDDSLNRAIARVRKILGEVAPGSSELETIPRTGYRLTGDILTTAGPGAPGLTEPSPVRFSRRVLLGSAGGALAIGAAGAGLWAWRCPVPTLAAVSIS